MTKMNSLLPAITLLITINASVQPISQTLLSQLPYHNTYTQKSLLQMLDTTIPPQLKQHSQMQYEIVRSFITEHLTRTEMRLREIKHIFDEQLARYENQWKRNMENTVMRELGFDTSDERIVREVRARPDKYSINYETYKILTFSV